MKSTNVGQEVRHLLMQYEFVPEEEAYLVGERVAVEIVPSAPAGSHIGDLTFRLFPPGNYAPVKLRLEQRSRAGNIVQREARTDDRGEATLSHVLLDVSCRIEARAYVERPSWVTAAAGCGSWIMFQLKRLTRPPGGASMRIESLAILRSIGLAACAIGLLTLAVWQVWLRGGVRTPPWLMVKIREFEQTGWASLGPDVSQFEPAAGYLAAESSTELRALGPIGSASLSRFPTFRWSSVAGAETYAITIESEGSSPLITNGLPQTFWLLGGAGLAAGRTYFWQVSTDARNHPYKSPKRSLYVLTDKQTALVRAAEEGFHDDPARLTALYEAWGLYDEAMPLIAQFQRQSATNAFAAKVTQAAFKHGIISNK